MKQLFLKNVIKDPVALGLINCYSKQYSLEKTEKVVKRIVAKEQKQRIGAWELFPIVSLKEGADINKYFLLLSFASNVLVRIFPLESKYVLLRPQERIISPGPEAYALTDNWGFSYPSRAGRYHP